MNVLVAGECRELLDARLDVVAGHPLPGGDAIEVYMVEHGLIGIDDAVRNVYAQVALGAEYREPEAPLGPYLLLG